MKATEYWLEKIFGLLTRNQNILSDLSSDSNYAQLQTAGYGAMLGCPTVIKTFTIAINTSLSGGVDMEGLSVFRILTPATWTAANLTFMTSQSDFSYQNFYKEDGSEYTVTLAVNANRSVCVDPVNFMNMKWMRIRSGTAATPVNQGAACTLYALCRYWA